MRYAIPAPIAAITSTRTTRKLCGSEDFFGGIISLGSTVAGVVAGVALTGLGVSGTNTKGSGVSGAGVLPRFGLGVGDSGASVGAGVGASVGAMVVEDTVVGATDVIAAVGAAVGFGDGDAAVVRGKVEAAATAGATH